MKKKMMKCPKKINKLCSATKESCNHSVKHKENRWCKMSDKICPDCIELHA